MRKPYRVTVRRLANGTDYSATLRLKDPSDAFSTMARKVRLVDGISRDALRLVDVTEAREALRIHAGIRLD
jgi:hypothetical protein